MKKSLAVALLFGWAGVHPLAAVAATTPAPQAAGTPVLSVREADLRGFVVTFRPNLREAEVVLNGKAYDSLALLGSVAPAPPGAPSVPFIARPFALPAGARATARIVSLTTTRRLNRWLRPTPPNWEDDGSPTDPPVVEDPAYYASAAPYPASLVTVRTGGPALGGTRSGVLQLSAARFSPGSRTLDLVREMTVEVTFDRAFAARPVVSRLLDVAFADNYLNRAVIDGIRPPFIFGSPQLLIVTDTALKPAADRLAVWKEQKGIDTWVVTTAAIGSSAADIKAYIQSLYDAPLGSNLAYVLFLGDVEIIPTNYVGKSSDPVGSPPSLASDLPYAQLDPSGDAHADVAYGRISVDTVGEADDVVDKILDYEKTPSFDTATYNSLLFAGYFQDDPVRDGTADRPYLDVLEEIRNVLLARGKTIDRFYDNSSLPDVAAGPLVFNDGTPLPPELLLANGFDWDASAADIQGAFNAGRGIVWHRDHGSRDGWSRPGFSISNLGGLTNGNVDPADEYEDRLPVVFSINCSSGTFDQETNPVPPVPVRESFAEEILRQADGGAVAVIAASRASSTSRNQVLSRGLFDALWGEVLATFDPSMAWNPLPSTLRLGDVLNYAKEWVLTTYPDPADAYTIDQLEMYHLHGDPTLDVWTALPATLAPTLVWIERTPGDFVLQVQVQTLPVGLAPPHFTLWDAVREVAPATVVRALGTLDGKVDWTYELDFPDGATGDITLYLTYPHYRPYIAVVHP
jgi:peptidase C25-like protein